MKQLTEDELSSFKSKRNRYFDLKSQIADISINEERLKRQKESALFDIEIAYDELSKMQNDIHEKYGEGTVDLKTGHVSNS